MGTTTEAEQRIAELYDRHAPSLRRYLARLTGNHEEAEDLTQETFIKALRSWGQLKDRTSAAAWLFRIARNAAYDSLRLRRRRPSVVLAEVTLERLAAPDLLFRMGEAETALAALRRLPTDYRLPLLLHAVAGYQLEEIAATLGWKLGTVKSRLHRARLKFRAHYAGP